MKRCPVCNKEYPDEHRFCREDATALVPVDPSASGSAAMQQQVHSGNAVDGSARPPLFAGEGGEPPADAGGAASAAGRSRRAAPVSVVAAVAVVAVLAAISAVFARQRAESSAVRGGPADGAAATAGAAALSSAPGTVAAAGQQQWRRHYCQAAGCSLEIPEGWTGGQVEDGDNKDLVRWRFNAPGSKWVSVTVDIDVARGGTPAIDVWRDLDRRFAKGFKERYRREEVGEAQLNDRHAALWTFQIQRKGQPWLRKVDYGVTLEDGRGVALLLTAPPGEFAQYEPIFDEVVRRFRWEDAVGD